MVLEAMLLVNADRELTAVLPLEVSAPLWKRALYSAWTLLTISHVVCPFFYPSVGTHFRVRNSFYWAPEVLAVIVFAVCLFAKRWKK
jgi:hypothetical protein